MNGEQVPFTPLVETRPTDATLGFIDQTSKVNVADDTDVRSYCVNVVWEAVRRAKTRRMPLESEWLAIQRMIVLAHDEGRRYFGRSEAYLPLYARIRKTLISNITKGLFPSDEYMDVTDREQGDTEDAKACKEVLRYEFDCSARLREFIKPFVGQYVDFGISPLKVWYRTNKVYEGKRKLNSQMQQYRDEGLTVSMRSMFNLLVYPEWAEHDRDLRLIAERLEVPWHTVMAAKASGRWLNVDEAVQTGTAGSDQFDWHNQQTLTDVAGIPGTTELRNIDGSPQRACIAVEVWCDVPLPRRLYAPGEDNRGSIPARVLFINGVPVSVTRNPFHHQRHPYLFARDNIVLGSFYSNGTGRMVRNLQYLANDFANQTNDVGIMGLNPLTIINTSYFAGPPGPIRPGGVFKVRDINEAVRFESPKVELVQHGMPLLSMIIGFANDGGGAPPVQQGTKAASTATSTQILAANANTPIQDSVEDIEAQVMVPLMKLAWSLSQQYRDKEFLRRIVGNTGMEESVVFSPADIDIDAEFRFLSSSQSSNRQQRTAQMQTFMQMMQPLMPLLGAQGYVMDAKAVAQRFWNDALGFRGFNNIIKPMSVMQQQAAMNGAQPQQPGQPQPGQSGTPPAPPSESGPPAAEGGSAVPQGGLPGAGDMQNGEGAQMPEVLANGQTLAGAAGLGGGYQP